MADCENFLRYASPNEQRTITREDLGFYNAVVVGAIYEFEHAINVTSLNTFYQPLRACIDEHPYLSVTVRDMHTEKSFFQRVSRINLNHHISIIKLPSTTGNTLSGVKDVLTTNLDIPFPSGIPPWRIVVAPLQHACFIAFCHSHTIGDGMTGKAFHRSLLKSFRQDKNSTFMGLETINVPERPLPAPFDTPDRLPISWSFLLSPFISLFIPKFFSNLLGIRASVATIDAGTWTGSLVPGGTTGSRSKLLLREIELSVLNNALCSAKKHDAKLTGVFQELVAQALSEHMPDERYTNFESQTAINMRRCIGVSDDEGGEFVSGCYIVHARGVDQIASFTEENWAAAKSSSIKLAESAATLQDQAIGLLRYLPSMKKWTLGKLGQRRDCSFEVSNIGVFETPIDALGDPDKASITKVVFAQPGHILSAPLAFNLVSVKGGSLMYTVSWRSGALDIGDDEVAFVQAICVSIEKGFATLG